MSVAKIENNIINDESITAIFDDVSRELIEIGVPIPLFDIKKVGSMKYTKSKIRGITYTVQTSNNKKINFIGINKNIILDELGFRSTMAHELLHTVSGCNNHGKTFKYWCRVVNKFYPKYNIDTYYRVNVESKNYLIELGSPKYMVTCGTCGTKSYFYRKCKTLDVISRCTCKKCKTSNFKVESLV